MSTKALMIKECRILRIGTKPIYKTIEKRRHVVGTEAQVIIAFRPNGQEDQELLFDLNNAIREEESLSLKIQGIRYDMNMENMAVEDDMEEPTGS
jgi:hypothetical protein